MAISNPVLPPDIGDAGSGSFLGAGAAASRVIGALIQFAFMMGSIAFILMFLLGAFQWITSGGDKDGVTRARNRIMHALIGLVILFSLYAILNLLSYFFGVNLYVFNIPTLGGSSSSSAPTPTRGILPTIIRSTPIIM